MDKDRNSRIGQDFSLGSLLKFALPGLLTNLSSRLFETLDDALFVSRFVGQNALAGIKILMPIDGLVFALTHIFGLGASTYAATEMGRGNKEEANRIFTKMIIMGLIFGSVICRSSWPQCVSAHSTHRPASLRWAYSTVSFPVW